MAELLAGTVPPKELKVCDHTLERAKDLKSEDVRYILYLMTSGRSCRSIVRDGEPERLNLVIVAESEPKT
jgi:hypothetical protein